MPAKVWEKTRLPSGDEDLIWELFHENSKTNKYEIPPSDEEVRIWMDSLWQSLPFEGYPAVELPTSLTRLHLSLEQALTTRVTARRMAPCSLSLENVATILYYAYGITRGNEDSIFPRPFRTVPSGGALYPLEIFFHCSGITGLAAGIYHYNPTRNNLRLLSAGNQSQGISEAMVQKNVALDASLILFITAMFERTTFKYRDRGYRFVMMEAGHVAQNINLVVNGLGLGCINIAGFFDRDIDELLGLDGLTHSTIYMAAIGKKLG